MKGLLLGASIVVALFAGAGSAQAQGDPVKGERAFNKCKICHAIGEGAKSKIGPPLNDVIGAAAGTQDGFSYSKAMQAAGQNGLVWTDEKLDEYLENPLKMVPGTKMAFPGVRKESERQDVIAYLKQFSKPQ